MASTRKDGGVEAPIGLGGFFGTADGDSDSDQEASAFENAFELQSLTIGGKAIQIRQFSWHEANANQVWPGTFALADFIAKHAGRYNDRCLEMGSATGALAIYLRLSGFTDVVTCDIDDGGLVADNIVYNTALNGLTPGAHIPHTWGTGWAQSLERLASAERSQLQAHLPFRYIIASDILLYVSAYPALVQTLKELFESGEVAEFLMAWNRRISASGTFFDMMKAEGFRCHHHGQCIYSFYTAAGAAQDAFLAGLEQSAALRGAANSGVPTSAGAR